MSVQDDFVATSGTYTIQQNGRILFTVELSDTDEFAPGSVIENVYEFSSGDGILKLNQHFAIYLIEQSISLITNKMYCTCTQVPTNHTGQEQESITPHQHQHNNQHQHQPLPPHQPLLLPLPLPLHPLHAEEQPQQCLDLTHLGCPMANCSKHMIQCSTILVLKILFLSDSLSLEAKSNHLGTFNTRAIMSTMPISSPVCFYSLIF